MNYMDSNGRKTVTNMACPSPQRLDSSTGERFSGLTLGGDIHLGGRSDLNAWRHFNGRMAGVAIAGDAKSEVSCLFGCGHAALPGIATLQADICGTLPTPLVKAPLTSAKCTGTDHVAAGNCAMLGSGASSGYGTAAAAFSPQGARFNGDDDYLEIPPIDYASDSTFTISFWFTKGRGDGQTLSGQEGCTNNLCKCSRSLCASSQPKEAAAQTNISTATTSDRKDRSPRSKTSAALGVMSTS